MSDVLCPCGSEKKFTQCCEPYLLKTKKAPTAEALMRSRYSAYVVQNIDYVVDTHHESTKKELVREDIEAWSEEAKWLGLKIIKTDAGTEKDEQGLVEFKCSYELDGKIQNHHEISEFVKENGTWFFREGRFITETFKRESPKIGRNDPCSCGSGKKFKKCCGA